ncbi:hypothetical protein HPB50_010419 [Hyalomma asiaticum]|uniref:Uncharacterized protein n=1 Tax=Hyalomma asiaticum TaxID=266040 RepID=A0ACB7SJL8_HYAAI|nr:hypothetical protein HPB50_010419 [Hyalomma asiaticum]
MAPTGGMNSRPGTATATVADTKVGYDPDSMMWTTIPSSNSRPELPQTFNSAALAAAVARREQARNALTTASTDAASLATADAGVCSPTLSPPASRSAGQKRGKNRPLWRPQPLPKPKATDFVVVLKCRTQLSLAAVFPENGAGRALIAHLGAPATRLVTVVLVREQNLMLVYTSNPHIADKLIVGAALLGIDPTPVPAPNQTFAASAERQCRSRMAPAPLTSVRLGAPCVLDPTSPVTGTVRSATGFLHPSHLLLHRGVEAGSRKRKRRRRRKPRKLDHRVPPQGAQPSAINPIVPPHLGAGAIGSSLRGPTPDEPPVKRFAAGQALPAPAKPNPPLPGPKPAAQENSS